VKYKIFSKGQVSVETLLAIIMVFVLLIVVFLQNYTVSYSNETLMDIYTKKGECLRFAFAISKAYIEGAGTSISYDLKENTEILKQEKFVKIGEDYCRFLAIPSQSYSLSPSTYIIRNNNGLIEISSS